LFLRTSRFRGRFWILQMRVTVLLFSTSSSLSPRKPQLEATELAIVVVGALPSTTIGSKGQDIVSKSMSILERSKYPNVSFVKSTKDIFQALDKLSIQPRVKTTSQSTSAAKDLYTVWRSTSDSDYLFLYDKGPSATFDVAAEVWENKAPYQLNAWTGQQEAIAVCQRLS
jgi:hypothetical protein